MTSSPRHLSSGFLRSCERYADRPALEVDGQVLTYAQLHDTAASLAATLQRSASSEGPALTGVLGYRSATAFAGVLAALFRGHGYVPLNPTFPGHRLHTMTKRAGCQALIVDPLGQKKLDEVLRGIEHDIVVILPHLDDVSDLAGRWPHHTFLGRVDLIGAQQWRRVDVDPDAIAYLLFTSGSTGTPKGVMVAHRNINRFIDVMVDRYEVTEEDRFSQMFEMVFDLSLFDMFVAWERGACVCCPSKMQMMTPAGYVASSGITVWFSVPSVALLMKKLRMLEPGVYPNLRLSLFCGEALQASVVEAWAEAAPNSVIENLYGPTELTLACTLYRWEPDRSPDECTNGVVPIGEPYPGMGVLVADDGLREVEPGQTGELLMCGPQVAPGYWQDLEKTASAFVVPPGKQEVYYRTGDLVNRPAGDEPLQYLGRVDHQVKIHGNRVELGEIEAVVRRLAGTDQAVALGWPVTPSGADGIVVFAGASQEQLDAIKNEIKGLLPIYMVPREMRAMASFPHNSNGKVDRKALMEMLASGSA